MIHEYFGVDLTLVWATVQKDLPVLRDAILGILKEESPKRVNSKLRIEARGGKIKQ